MNGQLVHHRGKIAIQPGIQQWWYRWEDVWSLSDWAPSCKPVSGPVSLHRDVRLLLVGVTIS